MVQEKEDRIKELEWQNEKLLSLKEDSEGLLGMHKAWVECQKELENPKEKSRGNYANYAKLEDILKDCLPILNKHGFALTQSTVLDNSQTWMATTLEYKNGESIVSRIPIFGDFKDMMKFGAGLTYARRYSLCMLLGIEGERDPDGDKINSAQYDILYGIFSKKGLSDNAATAALKHYYDYEMFSEIDAYNFGRVKKMFENFKPKA